MRNDQPPHVGGFAFEGTLMADEQDFSSVLYQVDPFGKIDITKPLRLLPQGTWFRGARKLEVTADRLQEMAKNFKGGQPNFRVGINLDHEENGGKVGDIKDVAYLQDGPKGPGLYATDYDLLPKGMKAVEEDGYDGVSAEVVWTLNNGAKYQDPRTGTEMDNVLVGLALTPQPFFGHDELAIYHTERGEVPVEKFNLDAPGQQYLPYGGASTWDEYDAYKQSAEIADEASDMANVMKMLMNNAMTQASQNGDYKSAATAITNLASGLEKRYSNLGQSKDGEDMRAKFDEPEYFRTFTAEQRRQLAKKGFALPDGSYPIENKQDLQNAIRSIGRTNKPKAQVKRHIIKRARALGATDMLPQDWRTSNMSVMEQIKALFQGDEAQEELADIRKQVEAGELDAESVVNELGDELAEQVLGVELMSVQGEDKMADGPEIETLSVALAETKAKADKLEAELKTERMARRNSELKREADAFKALPIKVETYVEKMGALEAVSQEMADWLREQFAAFDTAMEEAGLLKEIGSEQENEGTDLNTLALAKIKSDFGGDMSKYSEAFTIVGKEHPELAKAYAAA